MNEERPNKSGSGPAVLAALLLAFVVLGMLGVGGLVAWNYWRGQTAFVDIDLDSDLDSYPDVMLVEEQGPAEEEPGDALAPQQSPVMRLLKKP